MRSSLFLSVAVLATFALAGCAMTDITASPTAPSASPTVEPVAEQARETGLTAPLQVFGGDCSRLFTADEVSQAVGIPMTLSDQSAIFDSFGVIDEQNAALRCVWVSTDFSGYVDVLALPAGVVEYQVPTGCDMGLESGVRGCALESTVNDLQLSGIEGREDGDAAAIAAAKDVLLGLFAERATPENSAPVPVPAVGSWSYPVDCAAIVAASDLSAIPGLGSGSTGDHGGGSDAYYPAAVQALWGALGLPHCYITGSSVYLYFDAFGGGRWKEAELASAAGTTLLPVDGVDAVYATPLGDGTSRINVFDGPNWLQFTVNFTSNAGAIATALVGSLDATAVQ